MTPSPRPFALALLISLSLAACAKDDAVYPSLGVRPVEKLGFAEPEVEPAEIRADPALDARIAEWNGQLDTLARNFDTEARQVETQARAARGQAVGSEPWLDAQAGLAQLDDRRAQLSALVATIDEAAIDRAAQLAPDYPALTALKTRAAAEGTRQSALIERLQAGLPAA